MAGLSTEENLHLHSHSHQGQQQRQQRDHPPQEPKKPQNKQINLVRGWPSPHLLPADLLRSAIDHVLTDRTISIPALQYGPDPGYQPLREQLAHWLADVYGRNQLPGTTTAAADPSRICITGGASQSLACILQSFSDPGTTLAVWVVAPCYFLACPIFEDAGFAGRLRAVPEGEDGGVDLGALERGMRGVEEEEEMGEAEVRGRRRTGCKDLGPDRKAYRHIVYAVPTCANPSGRTMSLEARRGLVELARRRDALVVCDDVYDFLQWDVVDTSSLSAAATTISQSAGPPSPLPLPPGTPLPRLSDIDRALGPSQYDPPGRIFGHAISNGSFSKLVGPGTRTGWVEGTRDFANGLSKTGSSRSGGAPSQLVAAALAEMLRRGDVERHVAGSVRPALRRRHGLAVAAVERVLRPFGVQVGRGTEAGVYGGYFLWLTLREGGPSARIVAERASEENLIVAPGEMFEVHGDEDGPAFPRNIRLCYSWEEEEDVVQGVERLGRVLDRLQKEGDQSQGAIDGTRKGGEDFK